LTHARCLVLPFLTFLLSVLMGLPLPDAAITAPSERPLETQAVTATRFAFTYSRNPGSNLIETPNVGHRWYESILTQQQVIAEQIDELRHSFDQNLINTQDFLDGMSSLFERTDRLYIRWKKLGWPVDDESIIRPFSEATLLGRKDMAVGRSLNYLRLSLINFFLGYSDSNSTLIESAEGQVALSKAWRTRSLLFIRGLDL